jgi:hypothetical protein
MERAAHPPQSLDVLEEPFAVPKFAVLAKAEQQNVELVNRGDACFHGW